MRTPHSISVLVPVYNEVDLLQPSIEKMVAFFGECFADFEILIIESGSTDGSREVCERLSQRIPQVKCLFENGRNGFGSALKLGYRNASKDWVMLMTVDLPFSFESIAHAATHLGNYDCVLSYRSEDPRGPLRKVQSVVFNQLVKSCLGLRAKHINSALKIFKRPVIQQMKLISNGWLIDSEILYRLTQNNVSYVEVPVPLIDRTVGASTTKWSTPFKILREFAHFLRVKDA